MKRTHAETIANVAIGAGALAVAVVVLRDPGRRRIAWTLARRAAAIAGPWLMTEAREAWVRSGSPARPRSGR